jgi:hypothetical protein
VSSLVSSDVFLEDFLTEFVFFQSDPDSSVDLVTFESTTALFDPLSPDIPNESPVIPTEGQMVGELIIINTFTKDELNGFLGMVQVLPNIHLFLILRRSFWLERQTQIQSTGLTLLR